MHYLWDCSKDLSAVPVNIALEDNMQYLWVVVQNEVLYAVSVKLLQTFVCSTLNVAPQGNIATATKRSIT